MKIVCTRCGKSVSLDERSIPDGGARVRCPKCKKMFIIPPQAQTPVKKPPKQSPYEFRTDGPVTLYWLQSGGCGGDTWSLFNSDPPFDQNLFRSLNIEILWHPSLSVMSLKARRELQEKLISGETPLDILIVEGSVIRGPGGTGMFDTALGRPKKDQIASLARRAGYVLAVGTCASFGGLGADGEIEATGLQYLKWKKGGFLGEDFVTRSGHPVINLPGCPCHGGVIGGALAMIVAGVPMELGRYQTPVEWFGTMIHQGCTRNEYHEYRVEEKKFGEKGCLFYYLGCHGPLVYGPCNKLLWNRRSSKTRVGVPCFGCTRPDFPQQYPFFKTRNIEGVPIELPDGVNRAHYLAYKGIAAAAAPKRLKRRETGI